MVREVTGTRGEAVIRLGSLGKIYLMYLVVVMVAVLMNFERMLRIAPATAQRWLRPLFVAFLVGILSELLLVSGGLLFGELRVSWLAASAIPLFVAGTVTALALARRRLSDMSVPVARPVIYYSSVSLTLAGAFLLLMAVLSKVVPVLSPEARHAVSLAFYLLAGGGGLLLTVSPRTNRAVKRFVDRNLYANRYDYRREWERVSAGIVPTARLEDVCAPDGGAGVRDLRRRAGRHLPARRPAGGPARHGRAVPPAARPARPAERHRARQRAGARAGAHARAGRVPRPAARPRPDPDRGREPPGHPGDGGRGVRPAAGRARTWWGCCGSPRSATTRRTPTRTPSSSAPWPASSARRCGSRAWPSSWRRRGSSSR